MNEEITNEFFRHPLIDALNKGGCLSVIPEGIQNIETPDFTINPEVCTVVLYPVKTATVEVNRDGLYMHRLISQMFKEAFSVFPEYMGSYGVLKQLLEEKHFYGPYTLWIDPITKDGFLFQPSSDVVKFFYTPPQLTRGIKGSIANLSGAVLVRKDFEGNYGGLKLKKVVLES